MTQSETAAQAAPKCPPWCATDHEKWKHSHESDHEPVWDYPLLFTAYAVASVGRNADRPVVHVHVEDTSNGRNTPLLLPSRSAHALAELLEQLAKTDPRQIEALAAQVRTAAAAISGETS